MNLNPLRNDVDGIDVFDALRGITTAVCKQKPSHRPHHVRNTDLASERTICDTEDSSTCSGCKGLSAMLFAFTNAHASTIRFRHVKNGSYEPELQISWRALGSASAFYLNSVVLLWNSGRPIELRLFSRLLATLMSDIEHTKWHMSIMERKSNLWFWKVFVGTHALSAIRNSGLCNENGLYEAQDWFFSQITAWSSFRNITRWEDARAVLSDIVWPDPALDPRYEVMARALWTKALYNLQLY